MYLEIIIKRKPVSVQRNKIRKYERKTVQEGAWVEVKGTSQYKLKGDSSNSLHMYMCTCWNYRNYFLHKTQLINYMYLYFL